MSVPPSSWMRKVTAIFSPASIDPLPLFVPASARLVTSTFTPALNVGSESGCRWASSIASEFPDGTWHSTQFELFACAGIVCPLDVYGPPHATSSWQEPQAWREGCDLYRSPCAGGVSGPAPSGSPWQTAHVATPVRIASSCAFADAGSAVYPWSRGIATCAFGHTGKLTSEKSLIESWNPTSSYGCGVAE